MSRGILYMAVGDQFVSEAQQSAASVREQMPDIPTALATTTKWEDSPGFDRVVELDQARQEIINGRSWLIDSTLDVDLSPWNKTLYLDSDTYVARDVSDLFDLLDHNDLAVSPVPGRPDVDGLPEHWGLYNCGVIAFRDSTATQRLFDEWTRRYHSQLSEQTQPVDQPTFARTLYEFHHRDGFCWHSLPRNYNVRFPRRGAIDGAAKLIHGRHPAGLERVAQELNEYNHLRAFSERSLYLGPAMFVHQGGLRYHLERYYRDFGAWAAIQRVVAWGADQIFNTEYGDWVQARYRGNNRGGGE